MKTNYFSGILLLIAMIFNTSAEAKIWRVNNHSDYNNSTLWGGNYGGTTIYPVFKQINQATAWAGLIAGDTIHVEGSSMVYDPAIITKKVVVIGAGYFLSLNPKVSNTTYDTKISAVTFNTGSQGSQVMGMNVVINGNIAHGYVNVNVNGITVKRCRMERGIAFATSLSDVYILQNFFAFLDSTNANALYTNGNIAFIPPNDIIFNNNICQNKLIWKNSTLTWNILECNNNVFDGPANSLNLEFNTGSFKNNILKANGITATINQGTNNNVQHNTVATANLFTGTIGNLLVANMSALFVTSGTPDGLYQLQTGASNIAGSDGASRGAFGGVAVTNRYTLSGLAAIPVIYETTTSGVSQQGVGLPVMVKARTIK